MPGDDLNSILRELRQLALEIDRQKATVATAIAKAERIAIEGRISLDQNSTPKGDTQS